MSVRVSVPLRAAAIPKAGPGTVIGVADVVDRGANLLARVALRAGRPADVVLPRGERCLVRAWSPYLRMQPAVVTPGDSGEVLLDVRKSPAGRPEAGRLPVGRPRSSSGWVQVWSRTADGGDWSLLDPHDAVRVDDACAAAWCSRWPSTWLRGRSRSTSGVVVAARSPHSPSAGCR